jgi:hypothetical protein
MCVFPFIVLYVMQLCSQVLNRIQQNSVPREGGALLHNFQNCFVSLVTLQSTYGVSAKEVLLLTVAT